MRGDQHIFTGANARHDRIVKIRQHPLGRVFQAFTAGRRVKSAARYAPVLRPISRAHHLCSAPTSRIIPLVKRHIADSLQVRLTLLFQQKGAGFCARISSDVKAMVNVMPSALSARPALRASVTPVLSNPGHAIR